MQPDINKLGIDTMLRELAAMEKPCGVTSFILSKDDALAYLKDDNEHAVSCVCKGSSRVPVFQMLRVECVHICAHQLYPDKGGPCMRDSCPEHRANCPGYRAKSLNKARLCLEELLDTYMEIVDPKVSEAQKLFTKLMWACFNRESVTEAVLAALHEASKVKA